MDDLLTEFLTEAHESLAGLDEALLVLERSPGDKATVGLIFRLVHTIKGTCGFLGLPRLERVAHAAENVLGALREEALVATPALVTDVLRSVDVMKAIVGALGATGAEPAGGDAALIAALDAHLAGEAAAPAVEAFVAAEAPVTPVVEAAAASRPAIAAASAAAAPVDIPSTEAAPAADNLASQTIRVSVSVLEDLMTLVSELVLTRNQLLQISRSSQETVFAAPVQRLSQITSDLQEGVMKTRMQPIGSAWSKLPRLVRDLSQELGKPMELRMIGAETEIDRQVLELVRDPLTHMVRNSADHGLELPEERRAAGKPETGTITLRACHEGGHITVEIRDDGRGLPLGRIREKALARGLASAAELDAMSEAALSRFVFHPGFSTAQQVTSVSGRGVGMDVVKTNIERIGGTIDLHSRPGDGTTVTINIPLTLAIVSALIVESGGERFAIGQASVAELVHADAAAGGVGQTRIERLDGVPVLRLRDRLLPLVRLSELLRLEAPGSGEPGRVDAAGAYVVVVSVGTETLGIVVDRVFDTEEIVVKPVAPVLRDITMFSGNTVLGDGAVIMILDPNGIARALNLASGGGARAQAVEPSRRGTSSEDETSILLFRAGSLAPKAVPLGLVARLEQVEASRLERVGGQIVTQYCGRLMPLVRFEDGPLSERAEHPVLVFTEGERSVGLLVDEILDVVHEHLVVEGGGARAGLLGTAVVQGAATEVVDTVHWLSQAGEDWFHKPAAARAERRLLVVEDSAFFRNMLIPALSSAGYAVTAVNGAEEALALREAGQGFDAIVSDIEMPGMDGLAFVRRLRAGGAWSGLPTIALSGRVSPADVEAGLAAGFTHYMPKFDREALLDRLARCLDVAASLQVAA